jgi:hypothetical protein
LVGWFLESLEKGEAGDEGCESCWLRGWLLGLEIWARRIWGLVKEGLLGLEIWKRLVFG